MSKQEKAVRAYVKKNYETHRWIGEDSIDMQGLTAATFQDVDYDGVSVNQVVEWVYQYVKFFRSEKIRKSLEKMTASYGLSEEFFKPR